METKAGLWGGGQLHRALACALGRGPREVFVQPPELFGRKAEGERLLCPWAQPLGSHSSHRPSKRGLLVSTLPPTPPPLISLQAPHPTLLQVQSCQGGNRGLTPDQPPAYPSGHTSRGWAVCSLKTTHLAYGNSHYDQRSLSLANTSVPGTVQGASSDSLIILKSRMVNGSSERESGLRSQSVRTAKPGFKPKCTTAQGPPLPPHKAVSEGQTGPEALLQVQRPHQPPALGADSLPKNSECPTTIMGLSRVEEALSGKINSP